MQFVLGGIVRLRHSTNGRLLDDGIPPTAHHQFAARRLVPSPRHFRHGHRLHRLYEGQYDDDLTQ